MDGDFLGETDDFIILDGSGKFVTIFRENKPEKYPLKCTVARIFCSPYGIFFVIILLTIPKMRNQLFISIPMEVLLDMQLHPMHPTMQINYNSIPVGTFS